MTTTLPAQPQPTQPHSQSPSRPDPTGAGRLAVMVGCLQALVVANLVQVAAGFAAADPSPPAEVVPGIAATALLGLAALPMVRAGLAAGFRLSILFALVSMVGMGPHKLFLADGGVIAPMAIVGFALEVVVVVVAVRSLRGRPS